ncbi:hypothetical protein MMC13_002318 [Lambiella insularis]|nr:hypothetical protein [Lambiella insularis]
MPRARAVAGGRGRYGRRRRRLGRSMLLPPKRSIINEGSFGEVGLYERSFDDLYERDFDDLYERGFNDLYERDFEDLYERDMDVFEREAEAKVTYAEVKGLVNAVQRNPKAGNAVYHALTMDPNVEKVTEMLVEDWTTEADMEKREAAAEAED